MKKLAKLFLGISLAAIGVMWILNVTGVTDFDVCFKGWWTLLIILPCAAGFIARPNLGAFCGIALGTVLLLQAQGFIDWSIFWKLCLAVIFIVFGVVLIFSKDQNRRKRLNAEESYASVSREGRNVLKISAAFGENSRRADPGVFDGADIDVAFGSVRLDLRDVTINEDVVVNVKAAFGGVGIFVPKDVNVAVRSHSSFGGVNNHADDPSRRQPCNHTILINAECSFAGVEVR